MRPEAFFFEGYAYDEAVATLSLRYRFDSGPEFEETLAFEPPRRELSRREREALDRVFRLLLLFCGVSYYKAYIPPRLKCEAFPLDAVTGEFLRQFYEKGLAEFAYRNRLSLAGHIEFETQAASAPGPVALDLRRRTLVPVGGGKDSIVTLECLRQEGVPVTLFALGEAEPIAATIAASRLPAVRVRRRLDEGLLALNRAGALNGHVPITGILSAIALAAAILDGESAVAMSNEHSASAPNLVSDGVAVNHQWSKSLEFETLFARYLADHIATGLEYFSFLRPLSEIEIARRFSRNRQYFAAFRSCNTAFRQSVAARGAHWCGDCPKCRFVFLALAPFLDKRDLCAIFGRDLLDEEAQTGGFAALCGLDDHKPFECVGEVSESRAAIAHLAGEPEWREDRVVRRLAADYPELALAARDYEAWFTARHPHRVPRAFLEALDACG
ncbi:MAG TPA: hypothetical protein VGR91_19480 [Stellaceae bacterium]|nr:hypothetical protein [Stellaceae bacterium]